MSAFFTDSDSKSTLQATHHRLISLKPIPGHIDGSIDLALKESAIHGHLFAVRLEDFAEKSKAEFNTELLMELNRRTVIVEDEASKLLVKIAFLVRAVETVRDPITHKIDGYRAHTISIMAQHAITQAQLGLGREVMQALWESHEVIRVDGHEWRKTLSGAIRVAMVAQRLSIDSFGWQRPVYLPTVDEDRAMIDLLVTNGLGDGVTIQVKSQEYTGLRMAKIIGEPCGGVLLTRDLNPNGTTNQERAKRNDPDYAVCRQLWKSTQAFNKTYGLRFDPVVAYVGR